MPAPGNAVLARRLGFAEGIRSVLAACLFFAAFAARPDYEGLGPTAFWLYVGCAALFLTATLCGAAWAFDAPHTAAAEARAEFARDWALGALVILYAVVFLNPVASSAVPRLAMALGGLPAAIFLWLDRPWNALSRMGRRAPPEADAGAYELEAFASRESYRGSPALEEGVEELLVSSGTFKVDRARMLEKLKLFQSEEPSAFLLSWVRAAVLSRATRMTVTTDGGSVSFSFDGNPLRREWVDDPYASLFEGGEDSERHKHMAYGLLAALRLLPAEALVVSGGGRAHLRAKGGGTDALEAVPEAWTTLAVRFDGWSGSKRVREALERLRGGFGLTDAKLFIDGSPIDANRLSDEEADPIPFASGGVRGFVYFRAEGDFDERAALYYHGALAQDARLGASRSMRVCAAFDGMRMNGFLSGLVEDKDFEAALKKIRSAAIGKFPARRGWRPPRAGLAYCREGLFAALAGAAGAFGIFMAAAALDPDAAMVLAPGCALAGAILLAFIGGWALNRIRGRENPFRPEKA